MTLEDLRARLLLVVKTLYWSIEAEPKIIISLLRLVQNLG